MARAGSGPCSDALQKKSLNGAIKSSEQSPVCWAGIMLWLLVRPFAATHRRCGCRCAASPNRPSMWCAAINGGTIALYTVVKGRDTERAYFYRVCVGHRGHFLCQRWVPRRAVLSAIGKTGRRDGSGVMPHLPPGRDCLTGPRLQQPTRVHSDEWSHRPVSAGALARWPEVLRVSRVTDWRSSRGPGLRPG